MSLKRSAGRLVARYTWQPDKWERLSLVADCVGDTAGGVLDVGGRGREMARLLTPTRVVSVNVEPPADVVIVPGRLPFDDNSFDVVTSCDVLEHMAPDLRPTHVAELLRVAGRRLVLCCPWGSPEKDEAELQIAHMLEETVGFRPAYIDDHIEFGLPTEAELRTLVLDATPDVEIEVLYQPHFEGGLAVLMDGMRARYNYDPLALLRYLRRSYLRRPPPQLTARKQDENYRILVIVDLQR